MQWKKKYFGGSSFQKFTVGFHSSLAKNARGIQSVNDGAADGGATFRFFHSDTDRMKELG